MSAPGETYARLTDFDQTRFCPYHGGFIALADCPIVATTEFLLSRQQAQSADARVTSSEDDPLSDGILDDDPSPHRRKRGATAQRQGAPRKISAEDVSSALDLAALFKRGDRLVSAIDGTDRRIVHGPPARPVEQRRRLFGSAPPALPVPAELADADGGARLRPARACPQCLHPLPEAIDSHDPLLIPLVGHRAASKTTTMAAFVDQLGTHGPRAFGVDDIAPTEATSNQLTRIMAEYRSKADIKGTEGDTWHRPLEFVADVEGGGKPAVVFFHDVAGEDVMLSDRRLVYAPLVLWADAILFIYNPESSPRLRGDSRQLAGGAAADGLPQSDQVEQAAVLNGLLNDLKASPRLDPTGRQHSIPPLVVAVSKADLLPHPPALNGAQPSEESIQAAVAGLGDGAVVAAGNRWPEVHWQLIAPKPPSGGPQGIVHLFDRLLTLATR